MRILALAVLATIIVVSGIWLARDRSAESATPAETPPASVSSSTADPAATGEEADETEEADAADDAGATEEAQDPAPSEQPSEASGTEGDEADQPGEPDGAVSDADVVPMGYTQVAYVTDVPQQAFDAPEQVLDPDLDYVAVIRTNRGDIAVELYEDLTPVTVNNFVFLALHRYFEGVPFHRVLEDFMAQTGDPTGTGMGGPGYQFDDEIAEGLTFDSEGILAMANAGRGADGSGTNGSQFFITFAATEWLNGNHTIFGHVIDGLDVLPEITRVDPSQPSAIVPYTGTIGDLVEQGVDLPVDADTNVAEAIEDLLGALPGTGQSFSVAGYRGVAGMLGTDPAFGFYLNPDEIESVIIAARAR